MNILINIFDNEKEINNYYNSLYTDEYFIFFYNILIFVEKNHSDQINLIYRKVLLILIALINAWDNISTILLNSKIISQIIKCYEKDYFTELSAIELVIEFIVNILTSLDEDADYRENDVQIFHKCLYLLIKELYSSNNNEKVLAEIYNGIKYLSLLNDYGRILKQRNFYLRGMYLNGNYRKEFLDILTNKLIEYGMKISKLIDEVNHD